MFVFIVIQLGTCREILPKLREASLPPNLLMALEKTLDLVFWSNGFRNADQICKSSVS